MPHQEQCLPAALIVVLTLSFFVWERVWPGRALPVSPGWYGRAALMNLLQLTLIGVGGLTWNRFFRGHANGFWLVFHQIHHSPSRIELLTSFYKHPIEIAADSLLTGFFIYCVFGGTAEAGAWTSLFGAAGEYVYHSNVRTPKWLGWFIQRPEHHAVHHELGVHSHNFGDITWWDRLFGTFKEADTFAERCGFPGRQEERLLDMGGTGRLCLVSWASFRATILWVLPECLLACT